MKYFTIFIFILVVTNLIIVDFAVFQFRYALENKTKLTAVNTVTSVPTLVDSCGSACQATIDAKISQAIKPQPTVAGVLVKQEKVPTVTSGAITVASSVKEYYVSFGAGSGNASDWTDVPGLQLYIDSTKYSGIKNVTFEAALRVPTANGTIYARLYNVTDKHPVWFSDVSAQGATSQLQISKAITLDSGNKLYQVQLKTTLQFESVIDQSRVHIILN